MRKYLLAFLSVMLLISNYNYIKANDEEEVNISIETVDGWNLFISDDSDVISLTCPKEVADENSYPERQIEIKKGDNDNYVNQFKLRLIDYNYYNEVLTNEIKIVFYSTSITIGLMFYIDEPNLVNQIVANNMVAFSPTYSCGTTVEELNELYDELEFFYTALMKYDMDDTSTEN